MFLTCKHKNKSKNSKLYSSQKQITIKETLISSKVQRPIYSKTAKQQLQQLGPQVIKVIKRQLQNDPYCPLKKNCFVKTKSRLNQCKIQKPQKDKKVQTINHINNVTSYRYKKQLNTSSKLSSRSSSLNKTSFLRIARFKKEKIPKNYLALQSSISGNLLDKSIYLDSVNLSQIVR